MKLLPILTVGLALAALDTGIRHWRNSAPVSDAPVWSLPMAEGQWGNTEGIRRAVEVYKADRGTELKLDGPADEKLTVFYFEWDEVELGPMLDIAGHAPEECNVAVGFEFEEFLPANTFAMGDRIELAFDVTLFRSPSGSPIYVYRSSWVQGFGNLPLRGRQSRIERVKTSVQSGKSEGRVLQIGVRGAESAEEGWGVLKAVILDKSGEGI